MRVSRAFSPPDSSVAAVAASSADAAGAVVPPPTPPRAARSPEIAAYYLNAQMYTCVPDQIRADIAWMADKGTNYICIGVLEQDLWAAPENLTCIIEEAQRAGLKALAVPSRWAGLTAGAPKVPSMFSVLHPHTWMLDQHGHSGFSPSTCGVISSIHWPETLQFYCDTLTELFRQHPSLAGFIIDEPKAFQVDYSAKAKEVLGANATRHQHLAAAAGFYDRICAHAKRHFPEKLTLLFNQAHYPDDEISLCAAMPHLDYFGADGRPWNLATDRQWAGAGAGQESGKGKVLLDGRGEKFISTARAHGKRSFLLSENHNLSADMIAPLDRHLPEVLQLGADLYIYYYFPRNVAAPTQAMEIVGRHLKHLAATRHAQSM